LKQASINPSIQMISKQALLSIIFIALCCISCKEVSSSQMAMDFQKLWNSGKVNSDTSAFVKYKGEALTAMQT